MTTALHALGAGPPALDEGARGARLTPLPARHVDASVTAAATGALEAQHVIREIQAGRLAADHAWLLFAETAALHGGWKSPACRAIVVELAKRLRPPAG